MENKSGFILINKEEGPSSHDIIDQLRKITNIKKIGHAGTLDPFASGLLIVAIGREHTKKIEKFVKLDKKYEAELLLGVKTDSFDKCGKIIEEYKGDEIKEKNLKASIEEIKNKKTQKPPMYSAKKVGGKKLYQLARKNIEIERKDHNINIFNISLEDYEWPKATIKVHCSSGTYIRSIANDIGENLFCGAHLTSLKRTHISDYSLKNSIKTKDLNKENWHKFLFYLN